MDEDVEIISSTLKRPAGSAQSRGGVSNQPGGADPYLATAPSPEELSSAPGQSNAHSQQCQNLLSRELLAAQLEQLAVDDKRFQKPTYDDTSTGKSNDPLWSCKCTMFLNGTPQVRSLICASPHSSIVRSLSGTDRRSGSARRTNSRPCRSCDRSKQRSAENWCAWCYNLAHFVFGAHSR